MSNKTKIRSMIDKVAKGELEASAAVERFVKKRDGDKVVAEKVVRCTNAECGFEMKGEDPEGGFSTCPKCGSTIIGASMTAYGHPDSDNPVVQTASYEEVAKSSSNPIPHYTLSYLRPGDQFVFLGTLPEGSKKGIKYTIIPARRGFVTFTDEFNKAITVPLCKGLLCPIKMLNEESPDPNRKFIPGDRVRNRGTNKEGIVIGSKDMGYEVRYLSNPNEKEWTSGSSLQLIQKDKTTESYISEEDNTYVVAFGDFRQECDSLVEAFEVLEDKNRPAFNRYSKMAVSKPRGYEPEIVEVLIRLDPRVWGRKSNLLKQGYIKTDEEFRIVKEKFEL